MLVWNNKRLVLAILILTVIVSIPMPAFAAFEALLKSGGDIFSGLRDIIYPASAIGIICVCMGGFFGNINWKWLTAIALGLFIISACVAFTSMFMPEDAASQIPEDIMSGN